MDELEAPAAKKTGVVVIILVILGIGGVGAGAWVLLSKNGNGGGPTAAGVDTREVQAWCKLRQEWAKKVDPMAADIMLKSVRPEDKEALDKLTVERNKLCQEYARKLREMNVSSPHLQAVEVALVKEGKTRANIVVEINNALAKINAPATETLSKQKDKLEGYIVKRIKTARTTADKEIKAAMSGLGEAACSGIYRGPMTDKGTSANPYVSWGEVELMRTQAVKRFKEAIKALEPLEQYTNRVYHDLVARYRKTIVGCFQAAKKDYPSMSDKLGFRLRINKQGKVRGLAVEWMVNRGEGGDDKFLDCIEKKAAKWRLPRPDLQGGQTTLVVVPSLDFTTLK